MIGETVSHYKILSQLGEGGMGVVYEAEDSKLGRKVALKFLSEETSSDKSALQRFQREARAASALNHPGICTIHAIEEHDSRHFIVMELLEGETLAEKIRRGPVDIKEAIGVSIEIADALESAHSKGIVHRDLKPANIFINERGQVKVLDFGLAKIDTKEGSTNSVSGSGTVTAVRPEELTKAGSTIGTVAYMSPEQARGQIIDSRTDIFSLGTVIYQMATGEFPFKGDTSAVIFDSILNREPPPIGDLNPSVPEALGRIISRALEKDRTLRYQNATDMKTELRRLRRDLDSGSQPAIRESSGTHEPAAERDRSVAVLYFENLSGVKEDEYFRDGITEDIITELSKIKGLNVFARVMILAYKDKQVTPAQIAQQLDAGYLLMGSIRRAGNRLRINTQLVDTRTGFPLWSERYDREMKDVFEVQDEIARKIADALRITLSPQEQEALAAKPTENLEAYDLYLRGRNYARKLSRQDLEFALQMFEKAASLDPSFTLAHAAVANVCAQYYYHFDRSQRWLERADEATKRASALGDNTPEVQVAQSWLYYAGGKYEDAIRHVRRAIAKKPDTEGAYYLLGRALFASGRYQELIEIADETIAHSGEDYNAYMPISNALGALGKSEEFRSHSERGIHMFEAHLKKVPEDARARTLLGADYATLNRNDDASRELNLAIALRPDDPWVLYNIACVYCRMGSHDESLRVLKKAWDAGFRDPNWARRDPDLEALHEYDEFEKLFPAEDTP